MKNLLIVLVVAILAAGLGISSVVAASEICGDTYTVQHQDNLTKIAGKCNTTISNILALNPQITEPNVIRTGLVLRITGRVSKPAANTTTYTVKTGDTLTKIAEMYSVTVTALQQANPDLLYTALKPGQVLTIPATTPVTTTSSGSTSARVSLSSSWAAPGDDITVSVSGFPARSLIDYRIGRQGKDYSLVYDGEIAADGTASLEFAVPTSAEVGDYWVVVVQTTSQAKGVEVTSPRFVITE